MPDCTSLLYFWGRKSTKKLNLKVNIFATLVEVKRYVLVGYYSVKAECNSRSEVDVFFKRMYEDPELKDEAIRLRYWITKIGNEIGGDPDYFRDERLCNAFPPPIEISHEYIGLRLYCYIINENLVVLYNGGKKIGNPAEKCPNVKHHFYNAQSWTKQIRELEIESNGTIITNLKELEFRY